MHRCQGIFAICLVLAFGIVSGLDEQRSGDVGSHLRYSQRTKLYDANAHGRSENEMGDSHHVRALGKSGKGIKAGKGYLFTTSERLSTNNKSSSECIKWDTSYVTELKPQYYYWRPYSSKSSSNKGFQGKQQYYYGKSGKGSKGRKLGKSDKIMVKYIEVKKEVKTCVEYKPFVNLFEMSGGKSGKSGGKSNKYESVTISDEVTSSDEWSGEEDPEDSAGNEDVENNEDSMVRTYSLV